MKKNRFVFVFVLLLVALLTTQCTGGAGTGGEKNTYKLAAIFPGVITDADYNTLAYVGVTELQKSAGVETAYSESVAVPDVERVMREYIDNGFNIIW
ncbi:MAG TPA: BMP family ABC transporter substrate-binding protein, partial [Bellilinea sp.]|nr:BMP family ABC transporter substrate-binding protein [Bellilinea sp.]